MSPEKWIKPEDGDGKTDEGWGGLTIGGGSANIGDQGSTCVNSHDA